MHIIKNLNSRAHALTIWFKGQSNIDKLRLLLAGIILQYPRRWRGKKLTLLLNGVLHDVRIKGSYEKIFHLLKLDDLAHVDEKFETEIESWFKLRGGSFIDVGANIGRYTIGLAENFEKVYAFEPVKETYQTLEKNIRLNGLKNIVALQIGLWRHVDEKEINIGLNSGKSSIVLSLPESHTEKIRVEPGDNLVKSLDIKNVSLIKIDAEGAETEILYGIQNLLYRDSPRIIVEVISKNHNKVLGILKEIGYSLIEVRGNNYLFEKKSKLLTELNENNVIYTTQEINIQPIS